MVAENQFQFAALPFCLSSAPTYLQRHLYLPFSRLDIQKTSLIEICSAKVFLFKLPLWVTGVHLFVYSFDPDLADSGPVID